MFDHRLFQQHRFALLDPAAREVIADDIATMPLVPSGMSEDSEHLLPRLVVLRSLSQAQRGTLLDLMDEMEPDAWPPLCAMLDSEFEPERIAAHMKELQVLKSYRGSSVDKAWLRVHDPRVFTQLLRILPDEHRTALLGPVSRWTIPLAGEWLTTERPQSSTLSSCAQRHWPLARIADIGIVNRALSRAGVANHSAVLTVSANIEAQILRARTLYGLSEADDLVEFAFRALTVSKRFDQHPDIHPLIRDPRDGEHTRLADRLARVAPAVWQTLND